MVRSEELFQQTLFREEPVPLRREGPVFELPPRLQQARALAHEMYQARRSREEIFLVQARLLEDYQPDQPPPGPEGRLLSHYYATYESLGGLALERYFVWRTELRRGVFRPGSCCYEFLYAYELLNQVGAADPMDGFQKLLDFSQEEALDYSSKYYLKRWLRDYLVYYDLPASLLGQSEQVSIAGQVQGLSSGTDAERMAAVMELSSYRLDRSRFYHQEKELFDRVAVRVLDRVREHYRKRCRRTMEDDYFGTRYVGPTCLFDGAVFLPQGRQEDRTYVLDPLTTYRRKDGRWYVERYQFYDQRSRKLGELMKTVDCELRLAVDYPRPLKPALSAKWVLLLVRQEAAACVEERNRKREALTFDLSRLDRIRADAEHTRQQLITPSELDSPAAEEPVPVPPLVPAAPSSASPVPPPAPADTPPAPVAPLDMPLTAPEYRYLHCLLYGGDTGWLRQEGLMASVLADGINEKLYETFNDTVLEEGPALIEDYIDELKEMVQE